MRAERSPGKSTASGSKDGANSSRWCGWIEDGSKTFIMRRWHDGGEEQSEWKRDTQRLPPRLGPRVNVQEGGGKGRAEGVPPRHTPKDGSGHHHRDVFLA